MSHPIGALRLSVSRVVLAGARAFADAGWAGAGWAVASWAVASWAVASWAVAGVPIWAGVSAQMHLHCSIVEVV